MRSPRSPANPPHCDSDHSLDGRAVAHCAYKNKNPALSYRQARYCRPHRRAPRLNLPAGAVTSIRLDRDGDQGHLSRSGHPTVPEPVVPGRLPHCVAAIRCRTTPWIRTPAPSAAHCPRRRLRVPNTSIERGSDRPAGRHHEGSCPFPAADRGFTGSATMLSSPSVFGRES